MNNWTQSVDSLLDKLDWIPFNLQKNVYTIIYNKIFVVYTLKSLPLYCVFSGYFSVGSDDL